MNHRVPLPATCGRPAGRRVTAQMERRGTSSTQCDFGEDRTGDAGSGQRTDEERL
jgi:hypothetical protein